MAGRWASSCTNWRPCMTLSGMTGPRPCRNCRSSMWTTRPGNAPACRGRRWPSSSPTGAITWRVPPPPWICRPTAPAPRPLEGPGGADSPPAPGEEDSRSSDSPPPPGERLGERAAALTWTPFEVDNGTAQFDLTLDLTDTPEGLRGSIEYNTDLF